MRGFRSHKGDIALFATALVAGVFFFSSLDRLWPLADTNLNVPSDVLKSSAISFLESRGFKLNGYVSSTALSVDQPLLDYVERSFSRNMVQRGLHEDFSAIEYTVRFKKPDDPHQYSVVLHPSLKIMGWGHGLEDDDSGGRIAIDEAREKAWAALGADLGISRHYGSSGDSGQWVEKSFNATDHDKRRDYNFSFERVISDSPELRERAGISIGGSTVSGASRGLVIPPAAERAARARKAPQDGLETAGFGFLSIAALVGFVVFLKKLQSGAIRLLPAGLLTCFILLCLIGADSLETWRYFYNWDPLISKAVSYFQTFVYHASSNIETSILLLVFIAAGDAIDRAGGAGKGESLWLLARGKILDIRVAKASVRGFAVGLLCGATMTVAVLVLERFAGGRTALQPRGFFLMPLNSALPTLTILLFFLFIALTEELGYRFFGTGWLMKLTGNKYIAVFVPALIYGMAHASFEFLPPAEPFWGRVVVLTMVGVVWGWAFLRYDALTVVLSHYTADLFMFSWPMMGTGLPGCGNSRLAMTAALTVAVPLLPAVLWLFAQFFKRRIFSMAEDK